MTESITVRSCTPADIETLVRLGITTFTHTFAAMNSDEDMKLYLHDTFTIEKLAEELKEPGSEFFLAFSDEQPAAYAKVRTSKKHEELTGSRAVELQRIYVLPEYIGTGVGKKLMQHCLDYAKQKQFEIIWLGVWEHNTKAIAFYEKWGFEKFSQHVFILGNDPQTDLLLKKEIEQD